MSGVGLWVDKYRPKHLDDMDYHQDLNQKLYQIASDKEIPHLLFYGPTGAGKKTRVMALLRHIFGKGVDNICIDNREFKTPTNRSVEISILSSVYHQEINPSDAGTADRFVVQEVIKEIASSYNPLTSMFGKQNTSSSSMNIENNKSSQSHGDHSQPKFKVVILTEVDKLSRQAQAALRRTMEKHTATCRLILMCNSASKVIEPVRSRCLSIRVGAPTHSHIIQILQNVVEKEGAGPLPDVLAQRIAEYSQRNVRRALLVLESCRVKCSQFDENMEIKAYDWEIYIQRLAALLCENQSPATMITARDMLYDLLTNCIPGDLILRTLIKNLFATVDDDVKHEITYWAAFYEHRMQIGQKEIFHLEAFIAKFLSIYKKFIIAMFDDDF